MKWPKFLQILNKKKRKFNVLVSIQQMSLKFGSNEDLINANFTF
jgi:hypothetical protein